MEDDLWPFRANFKQAAERPQTGVEGLLGRQGMKLLQEVERLRLIEDAARSWAYSSVTDEEEDFTAMLLNRALQANPRPEDS